MSYLRDHIEQVAKHFGNKLYQFVLDNGIDCKFDASRAFKITPGIAQECYKNAADRALAYREFTYVEGYVTVYGVPISHAWVIDHNGLVLELTLRPNDAVDRIGDYFGVPFNTEYVRKAVLKNKVYGLLDPYYARKTFARMVEGKDDFRADVKVQSAVGVQ